MSNIEKIVKNIKDETATITFDAHDDSTVEHMFDPNALDFVDSIACKDILGEGGMGIVFLGEQQFPNREIAIKKSKKESNQGRQLLFNEAMIMGTLEHPNIIPIHSIHRNAENGIEVVMKRIQGETLSQKLKKKSYVGQELRQILQEMLSLFNALEFAHQKGFIHRDIKPDNIMFGDYGEIYLLDWGIAHKLSEGGSESCVVGTLAYMAPEMLSGHTIDLSPQTDVYLMGATLHEVITGQRRHEKAPIQDMLLAIKNSPSYQYELEVPSEPAKLINSACHKEPNQRPKTMSNFKEKISEFLQHWDALYLCKLAQKDLKSLEKLNDEAISDDELRYEQQNLLNQAKFGFTQALRMWPDCTEAHSSLKKVFYKMIDIKMELNEPKSALMLLNEMHIIRSSLDPKDIKLRQDITKKIENLKEIQQLLKDRDQSISLEVRRKLGLGLIVSTVILICIYVMTGLHDLATISRTRLLYLSLVYLVPVIFVFTIGWKDLIVNSIGQNVIYSIGTGVFGVFLNRIVGLLHQNNTLAIMTIDVFILGLALMTSHKIFKGAYMLGCTAIICGIVSLFYPNVSHYSMIIILLVMVPLVNIQWFQDSNTKDVVAG